MEELRIGVFAGGLSWPIYVAVDAGFFAREGIEAHVVEVTDSVQQIRDLARGAIDIVMTPFDNVVAYRENQGEVSIPGADDLFAFMGGINGCLRLMSSPSTTSLDGLDGAVVGVDAEKTGYTLALYELLDRHGLAPGSYALTHAGGTTFRVGALREGSVGATMVSAPQDTPLIADGFRVLADVHREIGSYQSVSGVTCRSWAATYGDRLRSFIRAYVAANEWLRSDQDPAAADAIFSCRVSDASPALARSAHESMTGSCEGFQVRAAFDHQGASNVLRIRSRFGVPATALKDSSAYVDESFYNAALNLDT